MKNYLACPGARKGATVAVAALVTLTIGLGARALADGIEVVSVDGAVAAGEGIVVDGVQVEGQPAATEPAPAKPFDGPQNDSIQTLPDDVQKNTQKAEYKNQDSSESEFFYYFDENNEGAQKPKSECIDISNGSFKDYGGFKLGDGFYVVTKNRTFKERPNVDGDAKILLCSGATVNFEKGIRCKSGKLTIYAQSTGPDMGKLKATGTDEGAGIGGGNDESNGSEIVICGGHVEATGDDFGAGIGGGDHGGCGTIRILGGDVVAQGGAVPWYSLDSGGAAGIGSGDAAEEGGTVEISGGTVTSTGGKYAAGIGSGDESKQTVDVTISGGDVTAKGGTEGAGIGGGNEVDGGRTTISGGKVVATGGSDAAGIGGGDNGWSAVRQLRGKSGGTIIITGGEVTAKGNGQGAGIGGGINGPGGHIEISGGNIKAEANIYCAAIGGGGGGYGDSGTIRISGGVIEAHRPWQGYDASWVIGCGQNAEMQDLNLYGDLVVVNADNGKTATGSDRMDALKNWDHVWVEPRGTSHEPHPVRIDDLYE